MKKHFAIFVFAVLAAALCAPPVFAQASGSVKGVCKDAQGNPFADAVVVWVNMDNGQKYTIKTNKKGEYFSLGISPGTYTVTLYKDADDLKANKETDRVKGFHVQIDENTVDFDVKKEQENQAKGIGLTPEQLKQKQEEQAKQSKEVNTVKALNEKLLAAKAASDAGDFDGAIAILTEANQLDATRDLVWFKLGDAYRLSAAKQTDTTEKQKRFGEAADSYAKAIDLKQDAIKSGKDKDANATKNLAAYYNNMADAYNRAGRIDDAVKTYELAAQADPSAAAQSYFNIGAVLTNAGKVDEAVVAFDKCIAADPTRAEAYYQKGVNLLGKATLQGDKMVAAPGTAEAFQKYLELQPTGGHSEEAKAMLASIGSPVETGFKKKATNK
ncbi:MAG: carboxypeptidase regulatory-like domain-containing protein [Candidatus Sulfotelmatobacter sp.]